LHYSVEIATWCAYNVKDLFAEVYLCQTNSRVPFNVSEIFNWSSFANFSSISTYLEEIAFLHFSFGRNCISVMITNFLFKMCMCAIAVMVADKMVRTKW